MSPPLPPLLVVDDERNMRLSLKSILHTEGYDVQMVESAEGPSPPWKNWNSSWSSPTPAWAR